MTVAVPNYRWSVESFVRAWEAGAFEQRVELIDGEVWPVVIGDWHGRTVGRVMRLLFADGFDVTTSTLPSGGSLPDPDCWVRRADASPAGRLSPRLSYWRPADVLLVVEVSDETHAADLTVKARIYAAAGWPEYWVVAQDGIHVHTDPAESGYANRRSYRCGERVPVRYAGVEAAVADLIG
ncbi:Uma2 family endonuclease [Skermania piniformis]|uniref:Uma2 family endonuclease n=1 Tax=Skermania pinensis TaxID=39122 RepID=A0ABX8SBN2_9ACTN|nr:Uma2 family endonuclease [Skermania piniformis]QXQ14404.1 Uma2 family endonuclease [Skermania piniformis]